MNNAFLLGLVTLTLLTSAGCRRQRVARQPSPVTSADTTRPGDSTRVVSTPAPRDSVKKTPPASVTTATPSTTAVAEAPRPRPGIEDARANVAEVDFKYLTAKSKFSIKSQDQSTENANMNLRVRKDSLIWFSVQKLGIEAARGIATRDSIVVMDKVHNEYSVFDYASLSRQFNFDLNFDLLQALIVGNLPLPKRPAQKVKNERDYLLLRQSEGKVMVENYIGEQDRKLKKLMVTEQPTKNTLRLDYADFQKLNDFLFPYTSLVTLDYQSKTDGQFYQKLLQIRHNKVELVDKNPGFPFTIPASYKRVP
jgi:hypothetical protein